MKKNWSTLFNKDQVDRAVQRLRQSAPALSVLISFIGLVTLYVEYLSQDLLGSLSAIKHTQVVAGILADLVLPLAVSSAFSMVIVYLLLPISMVPFLRRFEKIILSAPIRLSIAALLFCVIHFGRYFLSSSGFYVFILVVAFAFVLSLLIKFFESYDQNFESAVRVRLFNVLIFTCSTIAIVIVILIAQMRSDKIKSENIVEFSSLDNSDTICAAVLFSVDDGMFLMPLGKSNEVGYETVAYIPFSRITSIVNLSKGRLDFYKHWRESPCDQPYLNRQFDDRFPSFTEFYDSNPEAFQSDVTPHLKPVSP